MRLAILADIHGNLPALEAVLADARAQGVDDYVVAGDLILGGPFPAETLTRLRNLDAWIIQGNGETYFTRYDSGAAPEAWGTSAQWGPFQWSYARLDRDALDYLAALPEQVSVAVPGAAPICVVHGSPGAIAVGIMPDDPEVRRKFVQAQSTNNVGVEDALAKTTESVLVCGHTHIAWEHRNDGRLAFNPGSVGAPIDGELGAEYALLTWQDGHWTVELRIVDYDVDALLVAYRERGMLAQGGAMVRALMRGAETGQNYPWYLVLHAFDLAAQAGIEHEGAVPDEIWERATATFEW
ncbi:MAG: metallophosphoesterase family protein [Anaerolineae bacterium]|nr:metallophosphoesterase family protein [Anaerolineae bacterium]